MNAMFSKINFSSCRSVILISFISLIFFIVILFSGGLTKPPEKNKSILSSREKRERVLRVRVFNQPSQTVDEVFSQSLAIHKDLIRARDTEQYHKDLVRLFDQLIAGRNWTKEEFLEAAKEVEVLARVNNGSLFARAFYCSFIENHFRVFEESFLELESSVKRVWLEDAMWFKHDFFLDSISADSAGRAEEEVLNAILNGAERNVCSAEDVRKLIFLNCPLNGLRDRVLLSVTKRTLLEIGGYEERVRAGLNLLDTADSIDEGNSGESVRLSLICAAPFDQPEPLEILFDANPKTKKLRLNHFIEGAFRDDPERGMDTLLQITDSDLRKETLMNYARAWLEHDSYSAGLAYQSLDNEMDKRIYGEEILRFLASKDLLEEYTDWESIVEKLGED